MRRKVDLTQLQSNVTALVVEASHDSEIYPDDTDRIVEFTAGTPANTWCAWTEVEDDDTPAVTLSSKFAAQEGHVSGILIEDLSHRDVRYQLCLGFGDDPGANCILDHRFLSGEVKKLAAIQFMRVRAAAIPAGSTIQYRMKSEQAGATCEASLRYHYE